MKTDEPAPAWIEAAITIGGVPLTTGQSMALRVAITDLLFRLNDPCALGDDEHGRAMVAGYQMRLTEVQGLLQRSITAATSHS